jgi:tRNA G26 N,N-dimethylase Trm1
LFIYFSHINPTQNLINYIDSAMTNLKNNGLLSVTSTDISSKFTRSSQVIKRYYGANVIKTSYMKELALRIVLANIVR